MIKAVAAGLTCILSATSLGDPSCFEQVGSAQLPLINSGVSILDGRRLYIAGSGAFTFAIVDVADPASPNLIREISIPNPFLPSQTFGPQVMAAKSGVLALADSRSLVVCRVDEFGNVQVLSTGFFVAHGPSGMLIRDGLLYIVNYGLGIDTVDLAMPIENGLVRTIHRLPVTTFSSQLRAQGSRAYISRSTGPSFSDVVHETIDLSNPRSPRIIGEPFAQGILPGDLQIDSLGRVFISDGYGAGVTWFDTTNPFSVRLVNYTDPLRVGAFGGVFGITLLDGIMAVQVNSNGGTRTFVLDTRVEPNTRPLVLGSMNEFYDTNVVGGYLVTRQICSPPSSVSRCLFTYTWNDCFGSTCAPRDLTTDGRINIDDLYAFSQQPVDLNGNGIVDPSDVECVRSTIRWNEATDLNVVLPP